MSSFKDIVRAQHEALVALGNRCITWYNSQSRRRKAAVVAAAVAAVALAVAAFIFHTYLLALLVHASDILEASRAGGIVLWVAVFIVGFPPLLGFSALSMLCGMVYGFPGGWPLLASASVLGSVASFLVFRHVLRNRAEALVQHNEKFRAFADILREDASLMILILIRLCPLPYSLSNGALAAIPSLSLATYVSASVITSPKMFMHIFIGHTIKNLGDAERPTSAKIIDVISILVTGCAVSLATYIIYNKMQNKLNTYHNAGDADYDDIIFGTFDDDIESGNQLELNSTEFDDDNFIIADDDDAPAPKLLDDPVIPELSSKTSPTYRDY